MNRAATLSDVDQVEGRGGGGTTVPGGRSVWDLETHDPGRVSLRELEAAPTGHPERQLPTLRKVDDGRRSNWIGLVVVLFAVGLVMVAGVWFLGADAESAQPANEPTDATLPAVAGNLDALADFTERSAPMEAADGPTQPGGEPESSPAEAPVGAGVRIEPAEPSRPAPTDRASIDPASIEPTETAEPAVPVEHPSVERVEADAEAPMPAPAAQAPTAIVDPVSAKVQEGPRVEITTRVEPCRFGSSCLVAGFVMQGFDVAPQEFICEFASGSRFTFRATSQTVDHACATGSPGDSITIEVAGVRSATVVHE